MLLGIHWGTWESLVVVGVEVVSPASALEQDQGGAGVLSGTSTGPKHYKGQHIVACLNPLP